MNLKAVVSHGLLLLFQPGNSMKWPKLDHNYIPVARDLTHWLQSTSDSWLEVSQPDNYLPLLCQLPLTFLQIG